MSKRRNRHGRGPRGPLVLPKEHGGRTDRLSPTRAELFTECLGQAVAKVQASCPGILDNVLIGVDDVPEMPDWTAGRVPLASAVEGSEGIPARVVLYRRPLELRGGTPAGLALLVHQTLVEQLSALTGVPVEEIDPNGSNSD